MIYETYSELTRHPNEKVAVKLSCNQGYAKKSLSNMYLPKKINHQVGIDDLHLKDH